MNLKNKKINISRFKKIIILMLMFVILVPSVFLYKPQKANALFGIGSDEANIAIWVKEYILDPIAYAFMNVMVSEMSSQAIEWINGNNYTGPGGGKTPGFVTQPGVFLKNVGDAALGEYIQDIEPFLCSPFKVDIKLALNQKYKSNAQNTNYCTLTEIGENIDNAYDRFLNDFNDGGWKRWIRLTANPANNRYGSVVSADAKAGVYISGAKGLEQLKLNWGNGFLSFEAGGDCKTYARKTTPVGQGNDNESLAYWENPFTGEYISSVVATPEAPCVERNATQTLTPGSFLQTQLSEAIGDSKGRLRVADEIDEVIGALISKLVMTGFDKLGLLGNKPSGEEGNINNVKQQIRNIIDGMTSKTQEYINIKKASLELIGKFDTAGVVLGTPGTVEQKVNWAGTPFEWSIGKYYSEDRSSKIDWEGEPFSWKDGAHYGEKNATTGIINEVGCSTLEDTKRAPSYTTTSSNTSPFWYKSTCLNIVDGNNNHINYEWGTQTITTKENSRVKAVAGFCSQGDIGKKGYTIVSENDGVWSYSTCERIGTSGTDWSATTKTNKEIKNIAPANVIIKKVDWNGVLFNWDEGATLNGRGWYTEPSEMRPGGGARTSLNVTLEYWNVGEKIPSIESLSTPPRLCFPASERRDTKQMVYGVKKGQVDGYEKWTILECTQAPGDPASETALKNFQDQEGDQRDYGMWKKLSDTPPAKIKIALEGDVFDNLKNNYGSAKVKTTIDDLLACSITKNGTDSSKTKDIITRIDARKEKRLQIIADIMLAEKMVEDVRFLESTFNELGANGLFDYTNFMNQLTEIGKIVGISDSQIANANGEKTNIETENALLELKLRMCIGGDSYTGTEADWKLGYDYGYPLGYDEGIKTYPNDNSGSLSRGKLDPSGNAIKIGYENGEKEGYYDGYKDGFAKEKTERDNPYGN